VVDGAEQPIANYKGNAFQEVAPYLMLDGHTLGAIQLVITDNGWNKLSEQQQAWVLEAGKFAQDANALASAGKEAEVLELLKAEGVTVIEVQDKAPWVEACQNTIKANTKDQAELYQKLLDLQ
jgi:TRAP-type C4-dicarboxylate transport system substrate-binding protein